MAMLMMKDSLKYVKIYGKIASGISDFKGFSYFTTILSVLLDV